jgi:glutamate carboxypeptidase
MNIKAHIKAIGTKPFKLAIALIGMKSMTGVKGLMGAMLLASATSIWAGSASSPQSAVATNSTTNDLSPLEEKIVEQVNSDHLAYLSFLKQTVNMNSGSLNVAGVKNVGAVYTKKLQALGFETKWIDMPKEMNRAGHLVATRSFGSEHPHILLMGHIDTVFSKDSPVQTFIESKDTTGRLIAKGPGVGDMKGGNTVIFAALDALFKNKALTQGTITVFFTGDEEYTGKPMALARESLISAGQVADVALNFEGGCPDQVVIGRRGFSSWMLHTKGQPAHSSTIFNAQTGAGANYELSRIINDFYQQVRGEYGLTFNVSKMVGGTEVTWGETASVSGKKNVVAQVAQAEGEIRFMDQAQLIRTRSKMEEIVAKHLPKTSAKIVFEDGYPAMEATDSNKALLVKLNQVQAALGLVQAKPFPPEKRGAADISFVAPHVTSIDGLGVCSGKAHTEDEWMYIDSLPIASQRAAVLIHRLMR